MSNIIPNHFANPWFFLLLLPLPFLLLLAGRRGSLPAVTFSSLHLLKKLSHPVRGKVLGLTFSLFIPALILAVIGMARPQHVRTYEKKSSNGIELMITLDVSRSMLGEDLFIGDEKVNRLLAAKNVMRDFIAQRPSDRIGIVSFAGRPYISSALTLDHDWLQGTVDGILIGLVEDGTAIGSAIAQSARLLDKRKSRSKIIILLTDGSNNSGNLTPADAARLAATLGIKIYTIAVGTDKPVRIPLPQGSTMIRAEFDIETLQEVARISGGRFFRAQDTAALEESFREINKMETSAQLSHQVVDVRELFPVFVGAALGFASLALIVHECLPWVSP